ncbi:MAG: phosphate acyltransferase PlsX [Dehalococcoidia bacterium]|nr:phosphate acyltransferase PlsX [Dehalococcoidia bacterium]
MRIAVDAMGGERAPQEVVRGAVMACRDRCGEIVLVGKESILRSELAHYHPEDSQLSIVDANEVVELHEHPAQAVRQKRDSSIVVGMNLLKRGDVSAFVSAGNSGAVMAAALLTLGNIKGIERPALGFLFSGPEHPVLLLDVGANADCKPGFLVQFAQMGSVYMERVYAMERPRIGLLSNGEEENKGNQLVRESHKLLKNTSLNFIGNVEGNDVVTGKADVVVTDGFTGNVLIKEGEGLGELVLHSLRRTLARRPHLRIAAFFWGSALRNTIKRLDYSEHGGAPLLGVNGNVIIAHGRSDAKAIQNAIFTAKQVVEQGVLEALRTGIK